MGSVSNSELATWLEQVADSLDSGLQASDAVALSKPLSRGRSQAFEQSLKNGQSWTESFDQIDLGLSVAERSILRAAEMGGNLPRSFRRLAEKRQERSRLKRRIGLSLAYPLFLVHFAALVFSVSYLFSGDTPRFLVSLAMVLVPVWLLIGCLFMLNRLWPEGVRAMSRAVPILSAYRKSDEFAVFCDTLAACLEAGMPVDRAWESAVQAADAPKVYEMGEAALLAIQNGGKASDGIAAVKRGIPRGLLQAYKSGEETGKLVQNLEAASLRYHTDAKNKVFLASMLYPKILLVIVFGYIGYRVLKLVLDYYEGIGNIGL